MKKTRENNTIILTRGSLIAALYVVLTFASQMVGLASGPVQFRLSEALVILPVFTWAAVPGLTVGCLIANLLTGCAIWDVVFGTLATFIGAMGTYYMGKKNKEADKHQLLQDFSFSFPPIISNMLIVPLVLMYVYGADGSYIYFVLTVGLGEVVCAGLLGTVLYRAVKKTKIFS